MLRGLEQAAAPSGRYQQAVPGGISNPRTTGVNPVHSGPKVTRNRQPVSCAACRKSKLKCDRQKPCEACIRRGSRDQCFYEAAKLAPRKKGRTAGSHNAQEHLKNLEALVLQMAQSPGSANATPTSSVGSSRQPALPESHPPSEGHVTFQGNALTYVGSTHWSAILDNIQELKTVIISEDVSEDGHADETDPFDPDTLILFSTPRPASLETILGVLPPRHRVDRYLATYFKASYVVLPILHKGRFQREYEDFWRDPLRAPPLWTSMLFSILTTASAVTLMNQSAHVEEEQTRREQFLGAAAQCLVFGNYEKPQAYVMEALILFVRSKYVASLDPSREVTLICALIFRFAYEMGYHRDPSNLSHLTVFEGEMRRRVWAVCLVTDLQQAFQLGLPTYITSSSYDTKPFSNLADTDFDESSTSLPAPRPETSPTRNLQYAVKCRLLEAFAPAFRAAISLTPIPIETVLELDKAVRLAHSTIPASLQPQNITPGPTSSSSIIMSRINISLTYHRTLCTLHRKPMITGHTPSRGIVRTSAMAILTNLLNLRREMQPGHMLAGEHWLMNCYAVQDFLFASMLLCFVVAERRGDMRAGEDGLGLGIEIGQQDAVGETGHEIDMIREAWRATVALSEMSKQARRVSAVLGRMLANLEGNLRPQFSDPNTNPRTASHGLPLGMPQDRYQNVGVAAAFPAAVVNANANASDASTAPLETPSQFTFQQDPFENMDAIPDNIDWAYLNRYYLSGTMGLPQEMGLDANMFLYNVMGR